MDTYWDTPGMEVALIIVICIIGFVLIICVTAAIWFTVAQRNKKARIPRRNPTAQGYTPYIGQPSEPKVIEGGQLVTDRAEQDRVYRELTMPGRTITSV